MKVLLLLGLIAPLILNSCTSFGEATGFTRAVPTSVAKQGKWAIFKYRVLEQPDDWDTSFNPLLEPGDDGSLPSVERLHRANIRLITENPGYGVYEDMMEDWVPLAE